MTNKFEEETNETEPTKPFKYYESPTGQRIHHFYISESVEEPAKYIDMIHRIKTAGPTDLVYIYLNTPGGYINTGIQIISAIKSSQAHVVTVLEGEVCSLGTLIFLSGDEFVVNDFCMFMIHNYSGGTYGKGHEQVAQLEAMTREWGKLAHDIYVPFLTEEELERVIKGEDLWMGSDEVRTRLQKMLKIMEREAKAQLKAEKAAMKITNKK
jgi:ATP-dependent protease ClpP protease subunit